MARKQGVGRYGKGDGREDPVMLNHAEALAEAVTESTPWTNSRRVTGVSEQIGLLENELN